MQRLQSIFRLGLKELSSLARDTALVGLIIYSFSYAVYGPAVGARMELRDASIAVVDEDRSALSARITDALLPPSALGLAIAATGGVIVLRRSTRRIWSGPAVRSMRTSSPSGWTPLPGVFVP